MPHETDDSAADRLKAKGRVIQDDVREFSGLAREAAAEKVGDARRHAGDYVDEKKARLSEFEDDLVERIRMQPMKSVAIAAGVGVLIGMLIVRRR